VAVLLTAGSVVQEQVEVHDIVAFELQVKVVEGVGCVWWLPAEFAEEVNQVLIASRKYGFEWKRSKGDVDDCQVGR
jgi:uncharacterized membrane protein